LTTAAVKEVEAREGAAAEAADVAAAAAVARTRLLKKKTDKSDIASDSNYWNPF
jgi:hypothetical protein